MPEVKETYRIFFQSIVNIGIEVITEQFDSTNWKITAKDNKGKRFFGPVYTHSVDEAKTLHNQVVFGFGMNRGYITIEDRD